MPKQNFYWKNLALNMLIAFQSLFIGSTATDFFLTVLVDTNRSQVLFGFSSLATVAIILPWILGIFMLSIMLGVVITSENSIPWIPGIDIEYIGMLLLYLVLFLIAIFNPLIAWPIIMNYLVHAAWVCVIIYFRVAIKA